MIESLLLINVRMAVNHFRKAIYTAQSFIIICQILKNVKNMLNETRNTRSKDEVIEQLQARIFELEDFQQRVEASASDSIGLAEELAIARELAEASLKEAHAYQETIQQLALYDPLTGVANRNLFHEKFEDALNQGKRENKLVALLLFDLDHFKNVNDSFGHPVGDELLIYVTERLIEATRETDTVARLGGDEFAIILTNLEKDERASIVAERIVSALKNPITIDRCLIKTGTSIGIGIFPRDAEDSKELTQAADTALYTAKENGRGHYSFYDKQMDKQAKAAHILDNEMRLAIVRREFVMHYRKSVV